MATFLQIAVYVGIAALVIVLFLGLANIVRSDPGQASRSNKLMRLRVIIQAGVILLLVLRGVALGSINLGG